MPVPTNNPQVAAELRDRADVQGKLGVSLDEIIVPTMAVGGDFPELPWDGIAGGWCWGGLTSSQPDPGENAFVWLRNPTGSGIIARVYQIGLNIEAGAAAIQQTAAFGVTTAFVNNPVTSRRICDLRRSRDIGGQNTVVQLHEASQAGGPLLLPQRLVTLNAAANEGDRYDFPANVILVPGTSLVAAAQQTDQRLSVWYQWEERPVRTAERVLP